MVRGLERERLGGVRDGVLVPLLLDPNLREVQQQRALELGDRVLCLALDICVELEQPDRVVVAAKGARTERREAGRGVSERARIRAGRGKAEAGAAIRARTGLPRA